MFVLAFSRQSDVQGTSRRMRCASPLSEKRRNSLTEVSQIPEDAEWIQIFLRMHPPGPYGGSVCSSSGTSSIPTVLDGEECQNHERVACSVQLKLHWNFFTASDTLPRIKGGGESIVMAVRGGRGRWWNDDKYGSEHVVATRRWVQGLHRVPFHLPFHTPALNSVAAATISVQSRCRIYGGREYPIVSAASQTGTVYDVEGTMLLRLIYLFW